MHKGQQSFCELLTQWRASRGQPPPGLQWSPPIHSIKSNGKRSCVYLPLQSGPYSSHAPPYDLANLVIYSSSMCESVHLAFSSIGDVRSRARACTHTDMLAGHTARGHGVRCSSQTRTVGLAGCQQPLLNQPRPQVAQDGAFSERVFSVVVQGPTPCTCYH
eukprot:5327491-Amphidinium_carterae.2